MELCESESVREGKRERGKERERGSFGVKLQVAGQEALDKADVQPASHKPMNSTADSLKTPECP